MPRNPKTYDIDLGITPLHPATRARIACLKRSQWRAVREIIVDTTTLYTAGPDQCSAMVEEAIDAVVGPRQAQVLA